MEVTNPYKFMRFGALKVTKLYRFIVFGALKVTKPYKFTWIGAMKITKPCKFIGFGAMEVTKPYTCSWFGAMEVTKPYRFKWFGALEVTNLCRFIGFGEFVCRSDFWCNRHEPRRSRGVWGPSLAENGPKTGPDISGQIAFRYPVYRERYRLGPLVLRALRIFDRIRPMGGPPRRREFEWEECGAEHALAVVCPAT